MASIGAPAAQKRALSIEEWIEEAVRPALTAAGWEPEVGKGGTIWRNPLDAHWYDELRAIAILKGGLDPGDPS